MKVFLLGSTGLLGTRLQKYLKQTEYEVHCFVRSEKFPCNTALEVYKALKINITEYKPDCIINLVASTNVDHCENNLLLASLLNTEFSHILADFCRSQESLHPYIIHLSSDQVYSGCGPHNEAQANPINIYGLTKLLGEYPVLRDEGCVLRTNFFGKSLISDRSSFSDWLISNSQSNSPINVFNDVFFSPIGIESLCQAIVLCIERRIKGLYNLGSISHGISKAGFAHSIYKYFGLNQELLNDVSVISASLNAKRPTDMRMDSAHFASMTGFKIPTIEEEIERESDFYSRNKI